MGSVIANAPDALCVIGSDDRIVLMNDAAHMVFGSDRSGETVERALASLGGAQDDDGDELTLPDGRVFLLNRARFATDDQAGGAILRLADITPLRQAAQEREQMLEFLSHDMRSPQAAIITMINRFKGQPASQETLGAIQSHARHTLKLADDFVQLARLSQTDLVLEECDLVAITNEAIDRCYLQAQDRKISLIRPADDEEILIMADPWPLLRALTNLIDNAIKYSPPLTKVTCRVWRPGPNEVSVSIADQGDGVPVERKAHLFKPYGPGSANKGLSAGLGLSFVKKTVDRLDGEIRYQAAEPGSIFVLIFPAV
jgi:signal transduction histidine kinase